MQRPNNIPAIDYQDDWKANNGEQRQPVVAVPTGHDADRYNGAMMRKDPQMSRLLQAFRFLSPDQRDEIAVIAESMRVKPDAQAS